MALFGPADEVADIARDLIESVEQHKNLRDVRIEYVMREKAAADRNRVVLAKARKISGLNAFLARHGDGWLPAETGLALVEPDSFFVLEVAADTWALLSPEQRRALVDHELCHFVALEGDEGQDVLSLRGHDLEEFAAIVERHGLWKSDVKNFTERAAKQLTLAIESSVAFDDGLKVDRATGEVIQPPAEAL